MGQGLRRGVILDRDGVINIDTHYLYRIEECVFIDGIFDLLADFQARGFALVIATNQAGIARGYYSEADFRILMAWMAAEFARHDIAIDAVYHCPDHPTEGIGIYRRDSSFRKPRPGMFLQAIADLGLDPAESWAVGDKERDIIAATAAGIGHRVLFDDASTPATRPDGVMVVSALRQIPALLDGQPASGS